MKKEFEKRLYSSFIIIPVSFFFLFQGSVFFIFFLSTLFIATSYEWTKMLKKKFLTKILGILFLIISFYSAYKFRNDIGLIPFILIQSIILDKDSGEPRLPHKIDLSTGMYKGREILKKKLKENN